MDHDHQKENWSRTTNHYPGCSCPPFRYSPAHIHKRTTNPDCEKHGDNHG